MRGRTDLRVLIASFALLATACQAGPRDMKSSTEAYGSAEKQVLDIYWTGEGPPAPLILFIHGGGWSMGSKKDGESGQPGYFVTQGYAYASLDYRLVPDVKVEDQLSDV
ncbi:MAG TPA: alpha/beta hydrolase, partial [Novosphingobium sp.]|nr:alpha/beta hydrolase [Novosphingobium sp.]